MDVRPWHRSAFLPMLLLAPGLSACGADGPTAVDNGKGCVAVSGHGATEGHVRALVGGGVFEMGESTDSVHVGVYLNNLRDIEEGRKRLTIVYQFTWPAGDLMLTEDDVILYPFLEADRYEFEETLTIKTGTGMFAGLEGTSPMDFRGELRFGPAPDYTTLGSVEEHFDAAGLICFG